MAYNDIHLKHTIQLQRHWKMLVLTHTLTYDSVRVALEEVGVNTHSTYDSVRVALDDDQAVVA